MALRHFVMFMDLFRVHSGILTPDGKCALISRTFRGAIKLIRLINSFLLFYVCRSWMLKWYKSFSEDE